MAFSARDKIVDETAMWDDLPPEEHRFVWDEAEDHFWQDFNHALHTEQAEAEQDFQKALAAIRYEVGTLEGKRGELHRSRDRFALELRSVEEELARVVAECDERSNAIMALERDYRRGEQDRLEKREKVSRTMIKWFRQQRGEQVPNGDNEDNDDHDHDHENDDDDDVEPSARRSRRNGHPHHHHHNSNMNANTNGNINGNGTLTNGRHHHHHHHHRHSHSHNHHASPMDGVVQLTRETPTKAHLQRPAPRSHHLVSPLAVSTAAATATATAAAAHAAVTASAAAATAAAAAATATSTTAYSTRHQHQQPATAQSLFSRGEVIVDIVDADGRVIGPVERIDPWNQWVKAILELPVTRPVKIRRGRKFTTDHLSTIYERTEAKGVKWLSCMIQAIGQVQGQRCLSCDKNQGAFDDCIIVGGPLFQKCGNCEWNRQGCHGAALRKPNAPEAAAPAATESDNDGTAAAPAGRAGSAMQEAAELKARAQEALARAAGLAQEVIRPSFASSSLPPHASRPEETRERLLLLQQQQQQHHHHHHYHHDERRSSNGRALPLPLPLPLPLDLDQSPTPNDARTYTASSGFTPANAASRPPSRDLLTPTALSMSMSMSIEPSPQPTERDEPLEDLPEITRETLVLRHNGREYVYPEIVEGVPLEKIDQNHPYWDPKWPEIRTLIEPPLQQWQEKYHLAMSAKERGEKGSARFQLGRQVNRGHKILEFLEEGDISPYQLLGKRYTTSGKGSITSYDTLFRLCETLSELSKYGLDMAPVDWMRQRLHELWVEQGALFNVSKIIHNFYNDPKLTALRAKAGFKNIGRPSGGKTHRSSLVGGGGAAASDMPQPKRQKSTHELSGTPMDLDRLID